MVTRYVVRAFAALIGLVLMQRLVWLPMQCNQSVRALEATTRAALLAPEQTAAPIARDNIRHLQSIVRGCPHDVDVYLLLSLNKGLIGKRDEAIDDLNHSLQTADRPELYFNRGLHFLESGQIDAAQRDFAIAGEFAPQYLDQLDAELRRRTEEAIRQRQSRRRQRETN